MESTFYSRLFARMYDPFMRRFEERVLQQRRRRLLQNIQGDVLEVGCGTGVNFTLYSRGAHVIACEPSAPMLSYALRTPGARKRTYSGGD